MRTALCSLLLFFAWALAYADWQPPTNSGPWMVVQFLQEAKVDASAGRYEDSLAKYQWIWLHEEVSRHGVKDLHALVPVRLSVRGLNNWVNLGAVFPPALGKLKKIRDDAGVSVRAETGSLRFDAFVDFVSINMALKEYDKTKELFIWLDANNSKEANEIFNFVEPVEPILIKASEYRIWSKYNDPDTFFQRNLVYYQAEEKSPLDTAFGKTEREYAEKYFTNRMAMLVAFLTQNNKKSDASRIVAEALKQHDSPEFKALLEKAQNGDMPAPWWPWIETSSK